MAYYAFLDKNNIVVEVIAGTPETDLIDGLNAEDWYGNLRGKICRRTSYNTIGGAHKEGGTPYRKNYAGIGYVYDQNRDAFIPPRPDSSDNWMLDEGSCLWIRKPKLGIVGNASPIITADGVDFVTLYIVGANPNSTQSVTVNAEPFSIEIDADGYGEFELSSDVTSLLLVEWGGFNLEVAAL